MRVILADDQREVRSAMRLMLEEKPGINVVGEANTSNELLKQIKSDGPDLIMLDWELPGTKPKELVAMLRTRYPHISIIALSSSPQMKQASLSAGVNEFVCKSDPPESLLKAVKNCGLENSE